ncbi:ACT domain-containing protein [Aspergillus stella-maris]|uniref:ACT domain-containing protein n=1 Tax=Aspergillus stella-maris TaxID=1810926 RepID=UPI003CCE0715
MSSNTTTNQAPGETSLTTLLSHMKPTLEKEETYVFLTIPPSHPLHPSQSTSPSDLSTLFSILQPLMIYTEPEGLTLITTPTLASRAGFSSSETIFPCKKITLQIHSSLEAVGLMAAVSGALAEVGVSANVVSAFYHDHVFVPVGKEDLAMEALEGVVSKAKEGMEREQ